MCFRKNGRGRRQKFFQGVCPKRQQRMKVAGNVNNFVWKSILLFYTMEKKKKISCFCTERNYPKDTEN